MKSRAAVAFEAMKPLEVTEIDVEGPKAGECLVRIEATGVCHTDAFTLSGEDPEGLFPSVLGHEGGGVVEEVGPGVSGLTVGDHVIPLYIPECRECKFCLSGRTNLCGKIRETQGQGLMPDGSSRLSHQGRMPDCPSYKPHTCSEVMKTGRFTPGVILPFSRRFTPGVDLPPGALPLPAILLSWPRQSRTTCLRSWNLQAERP